MNDLRCAFRSLAKSPGFTLVAVVSLAIGIGVNTTIFSAMDAAFLRPLPLARPDEIVKFERPLLSFAEFEQVRTALRSADLTASLRQNFLLRSPEGSALVTGRLVTANYFAVLGVKPTLGRFFGAHSADLGEPIVVISDALWHRRFGGDPQIVGRTIDVTGRPATVVGIAPPGFTGEDRLPPTELWLPLASRPVQRGGARRELLMIGRLRPGFTPPECRAEAVTLFSRPEWQDLGVNRFGDRVWVVSEQESRMDHGGRLTYFMGPIVGLVLLVACANVSCLLLGRLEERRRELAVHLALGAGRWRIMRRLLTEGAMLSLAGSALGLLLTVWGLGAIPAVLPSSWAAWAPDMHLDQRVLWLTLGLSAFATLAFALVPAWHASRLDVSTMLKSDSIHLGKTPSRNVLVVAQVMIAMVFLASAGLFVRGFWSGMTRDLGFPERNLLLTFVVPERARQLETFLEQTRRAAAALPGVTGVTVANRLAGGRPVQVLTPEDEKSGNRAGRPLACNFVDPDYFPTLGIPLIHGRDFSEGDHRGGNRVAIVSQALARKLWPGENPVGQTVFAGRTDRPLEPREVVGVVGDVRSVGSQQAAEEPLLYLPLRQEQVGDLLLIVRTRKSPATLAAPVRDVLRRMESPAVAILMDTAAGQVRAALMPQWFGAWLGGVLGLLAFLMAISGLYGVIAYAVARRTRELGIRIALGAEPVDALWLVLRQGVTLAAIGILLGLPVAMGVGHLAASALYGISPTDPLALAGASLLVLSVALLACWLPARRATRVNPIEALRTE